MQVTSDQSISKQIAICSIIDGRVLNEEIYQDSNGQQAQNTTKTPQTNELKLSYDSNIKRS